MSRLDIDDEVFWRARRHFVRRGPAFQATHRLISRAPETACTALVGSRLTAVSVKGTLKGTGMVCDMIRLKGISRPKGAALQTKPGTCMIFDMIYLEGMNRPVATAMQTKPGTGMIHPEGVSRPSGHGYEPPRNDNTGHGHDL
jgi:hypothetical protein